MTLGIWSKNVVSRVVSKINKKLGKVEMLGENAPSINLRILSEVY